MFEPLEIRRVKRVVRVWKANLIGHEVNLGRLSIGIRTAFLVLASAQTSGTLRSGLGTRLDVL